MGMRFLVTAGNTRERMDSVRDWGNIFTGNTGFAIARALAAVGEVELLSSNREHLERAGSLPLGHRIEGTGFVSHADLRGLLAERMRERAYDGVFMTAAVADYKPAGAYRIVSREPAGEGRERWIVEDVQAPKVGSTYEQIAFVGERTEKLVDLFRREWGHRGLLVKFKLEVGRSKEELIAIGRKSRQASGADYLVANTLEMVDGPSAGAYLIGERTVEWMARGELAERMRKLAGEKRERQGDGETRSWGD